MTAASDAFNTTCRQVCKDIDFIVEHFKCKVQSENLAESTVEEYREVYRGLLWMQPTCKEQTKQLEESLYGQVIVVLEKVTARFRKILESEAEQLDMQELTEQLAKLTIQLKE